MADLLDSLKRKRAGFDEECVWLRFLHDAHRGCGGFEGRVRQPPAGYYGAGAEMYATTESATSAFRSDASGRVTYLDRYPREDEPKFQGRVDIAHYPNYVGPLTNLKVSYILRKEFTRTDVPKAVTEWREDVDGRGTTFAELRSKLVPRAAEAGWVPVLVDMDPVPEGLTAAQAEEAGVGRPRLVPLTPSNLLEWAWSDGEFIWAKIRTDHVRHDDWSAEPVKVHRYTVWTRHDSTVYETTEDADGQESAPGAPATTPHHFGRVPLTILRHAIAEDEVRGEAMHGSVATENRRLFNLVSELDEHIRSQAFAILVLVGNVSQQGEMKLATDQGLPLSPEATKQHYYLAPPASVADTLEKRIENTTREIYRIAGVEFSRPQAAAVSGAARRYEFAQTDAQLAKFARNIAEWELDVDDLVGAAYGVDEAARMAEQVDPPDSFDIEDLQADLKSVADAITIGIGTTAKKLARLRVVQSVLQRVSPKDRKAIEAELEQLAQQETKAAEALAAAPPPGTNPPPSQDAPQGDEDGRERPGAAAPAPKAA